MTFMPRSPRTIVRCLGCEGGYNRSKLGMTSDGRLWALSWTERLTYDREGVELSVGNSCAIQWFSSTAFGLMVIWWR